MNRTVFAQLSFTYENTGAKRDKGTVWPAENK